MSQHDYDLANQAGAAFRADLNGVLDALQSNNSGGTEPANTVAYMPWADTATGMLKIRNAANNGWVEMGLLSNFALPSVQKQLATAFTTAGTSTAYLLTPAPAIAANTAGLRFRVTFHTPPSGTPTLSVSGRPALPLRYKDANGTKQTITAAQVPWYWTADVETDGTDWVVLDIAPVSATAVRDLLRGVDGAGSDVDADLLDGQHGAYYSAATHNHNGAYVGVDHGYNAVGSLCFATYIGAGVSANGTVPGSSLRPASVAEYNSEMNPPLVILEQTGTLPGTWRCLGYGFGVNSHTTATLWQRIA